jgi:hypothetical protein
MNAFKQNIYQMLANNKITCETKTKTSLLKRLTKFATRQTVKPPLNEGEEEREKREDRFLSFEDTNDDAPQEVGGAKDKDGNEIITTCSPIEPAKGFVGKATATVTTAAEGYFLNPILKKVCKDLHNNQFSWNTFDELQSIINTIKRASLLGGSKTIQNLICTNLAPYTTFFPLNINSYISTLIPNNTTFLEQITEYEEQIINAYKSDDTYTDPLCVPMSIINKLGQK